MSAFSLIATLFVGVVFGVIVMSMMNMAKAEKAEDAGAAALADDVLNVLDELWSSRDELRPGTATAEAYSKITTICLDAKKRVENHEEDVL